MTNWCKDCRRVTEGKQGLKCSKYNLPYPGTCEAAKRIIKDRIAGSVQK